MMNAIILDDKTFNLSQNIVYKTFSLEDINRKDETDSMIYTVKKIKQFTKEYLEVC